MAKTTLLILFLVTLLLSSSSGGLFVMVDANQRETWCVAKPSTDDASLLDNIEFACKNVSCDAIRPGGGCLEPNRLINHASVVMNLYYNFSGRNWWNCDFKQSALVVLTDPSYGICKYP